MPINFETESGYYDGNGIFHPNTGLLPTPIPGVSTTIPINQGQGYDILPDVQPYVPYIYTPQYTIDRSAQYFNSLMGQVSSGVRSAYSLDGNIKSGMLLAGIAALALFSSRSIK